MATHQPHRDIKLSILDYAHIYPGNTPVQSLRNATESVQLADELGYVRYWFTEHHNSPSTMSPSPDLLSVHAAAHTTNIRVGSGGIMLPNHSPLKVVENFSLLEALHPGRVDLGIGRAIGTDRMAALALQRSQEAFAADDFPEQLNQLLWFFTRNFPATHPFRNIIPPGNASLIPDVYMLGSSHGGVQFALEHGLGFVFAGQLAPRLASPVLNYYRDNFKPSVFSKEPKAILSIAVITAETDEEARYLAGPAELMWARLSTGSPNISFPSLEEAAVHVYAPQEAAARQANKDRFVIGSVATVAQRLRAMAAEANVNEMMLADFNAEHSSRLEGYRLLAEAFNLSRKTPQAVS